jgi:hypothetical protein
MISILLVVIVILIGTQIASTVIKSIDGSESTTFPKHSLQKMIDDQKIFKITDELKETI